MYRRLGLRPVFHSRRHCCHLLGDLLMPHLPLLLPNHVLHAAAAMPPLPAVREPPHQVQPAPRGVRRHGPVVPVPAAATAAAVVLPPRGVGIVRLVVVVVSIAAAEAAAAVVLLLLVMKGAVAAVVVCMVAPTMRRGDRAIRAADSNTSGTGTMRGCGVVACQLIIECLPQPLAAAVPVAAPVGRRRHRAPRAAAAAAASAPLIPRHLLVPVCRQHNTSCSPCS